MHSMACTCFTCCSLFVSRSIQLYLIVKQSSIMIGIPNGVHPTLPVILYKSVTNGSLLTLNMKKTIMATRDIVTYYNNNRKSPPLSRMIVKAFLHVSILTHHVLCYILTVIGLFVSFCNLYAN